ncbi:MAG TPA: tyrosine--tRNA ligase [bacterium]|jgi:tyrosyl-tRNA synthetase|nr:tyrosine--tRNA ligase [bacterium]HNZ53928.1 tyrosine--tRNA ligase [bacterium]HOG42975.1 tyrosine--tRNA ligase [bacterium]HPV20082.1 tyrosine--tRNA ligase [bacterium]HPY14222.1 tyrosine--tRNA ligase [bacterium]
MSVYNELRDRGFISNVTDPEIEKYLNENKVTVYCGFDPTAESLHVGNLVPLMGLAHFQRHGHKVLPLIGGATGMIGDPSGKSEERNLQSITQVMHNADSIKGQMEKVLHFKGENSAFMVNNYDWTHGMSIIDWLRDIGKHFTLSYMLAKDSVKSRLASENGISYTEFSYMTLQSYDFLYLFRNFGCTMQFGGNDQWGNITAGIELVRRADAGKVFGMTFPLMTTSTGEKFGKSAGNAVWLDPEKTSPYQYYQYWINTTDEDVEKMMKLFTFIDVSEIEKVCGEHKLQPHLRKAQTLLAEEATKILHGEEGLKSAQAASAALFGGDLKGLSEKELKSIFNDVPSTVVPREEIKNGINIADLLVNTNMQPSKGKARNLIQQGGCYINNEKAEDPEFTVNTSLLMHKTMLIIRCGKKNYHLVNVK